MFDLIWSIKNTHPDILWTKLDQTFFKIEKSVYLAIVYISPENSNVNYDVENVYSVLLNDVVKYSSLGEIIIQGDFNAYTNTQPDFIDFDCKY